MLKGQPVPQSVPLTGESGEINKYRLLVERGVESLSRTEKQYVSMMRKYEQPQQAVNKLRREQDDLKSQLQMLEDELKISFEEDSILKGEVAEIKKKTDAQVQVISTDISKLQQRRDDLERTLAEAKVKIENKKISFKANHQTSTELQENLGVVKKENLALKKEISTLQATLEQLQPK